MFNSVAFDVAIGTSSHPQISSACLVLLPRLDVTSGPPYLLQMHSCQKSAI